MNDNPDVINWDLVGYPWETVEQFQERHRLEALVLKEVDNTPGDVYIHYLYYFRDNILERLEEVKETLYTMASINAELLRQGKPMSFAAPYMCDTCGKWPQRDLLASIEHIESVCSECIKGPDCAYTRYELDPVQCIECKTDVRLYAICELTSINQDDGDYFSKFNVFRGEGVARKDDNPIPICEECILPYLPKPAKH